MLFKRGSLISLGVYIDKNAAVFETALYNKMR